MFKRVSNFLGRSDRRHNPAFLLADESGSATVETVLWLPLIFLIFGFAIDFSMVFFGRSQALRVIQDANRNYSIGRLTDGAEIKTYVESRLASLSPSATAVPEFDSGVVKTTVSMPASELEMLGLFRGIDTFTVSVSAEHMIEYWES
jgi:Flp pilus assembly protein TadG